MSHPEERAQRIACELDHGQINQAASELRREVDFNPGRPSSYSNG